MNKAKPTDPADMLITLKKFEEEVQDVLSAITLNMVPFVRLVSGRNLPDLLEGLVVDRVTKSLLKDKAQITVDPQHGGLKIHLSDRKITSDVMEALRLSGFDASVHQEDKQTLAVTFPPLTAERRQKLMTQAEQSAQIALDSWRNRRMDVMSKSKTLPSKNEVERTQKQIEKIYDHGRETCKSLINKTLLAMDKKF